MFLRSDPFIFLVILICCVSIWWSLVTTVTGRAGITQLPSLNPIKQSALVSRGNSSFSLTLCAGFSSQQFESHVTMTRYFSKGPSSTYAAMGFKLKQQFNKYIENSEIILSVSGLKLGWKRFKPFLIAGNLLALTWLEGSFFFVPEWGTPFPSLVSVLGLVLENAGKTKKNQKGLQRELIYCIIIAQIIKAK